MNRRAVLATLGGVGLAVSGGCVGFVEDRLDRQPQHQFRLGWLSTANTDTRPHKIDLEVNEDGNVVHQSSHKLPGQDREGEKGEPQIAVAKCTWGDVADDYTIRARVDGNDWLAKSIQDVDTTGHPNTDCVAAQARYRDNALKIVLQPGCEGVDRWEGGCEFANE